MDLSQLGVATGGVWTLQDAVRAGMTKSQVRARTERGEWQAVRRGVLTDGGVELDASGRAWAAVLAAGGPARAAAAGRTAARLHRLPLVDDADPLLPSSWRSARHDDVVVGRNLPDRQDLHPVRLRLRRRDLVRLPGGPSCLSVARTLVDLARLVTHEALVCALDDALHRQLVTTQELLREVQERAGRRHVALFRRAVLAADGRAESPLETLARLLLLPVLPGLVPQVRVTDGWGRVLARLDLADERLRFGVECDGARHHTGVAALAADRRRERQVGAHGYALERVTWTDVRRDGEQTRARVVAAAEERRRAA